MPEGCTSTHAINFFFFFKSFSYWMLKSWKQPVSDWPIPHGPKKKQKPDQNIHIAVRDSFKRATGNTAPNKHTNSAQKALYIWMRKMKWISWVQCLFLTSVYSEELLSATYDHIHTWKLPSTTIARPVASEKLHWNREINSSRACVDEGGVNTRKHAHKVLSENLCFIFFSVVLSSYNRGRVKMLAWLSKLNQAKPVSSPSVLLN